ncbi:MAG: 30S ribosomal protein S21 [bacterium]
MAEVILRDGESLEEGLKRFKKKVQDAGILQEMKKREYYEAPSVKKKNKAYAANKKRKKNKRRF